MLLAQTNPAFAELHLVHLGFLTGDECESEEEMQMWFA